MLPQMSRCCAAASAAASAPQPPRVEANVSDSTQIANLTLEIEILVELWAEALYLGMSRFLLM
jgi:hypothetical protein